MIPIRGITVAVGEWYARTDALGGVRNMRHMVECVVVTDAATAPLLAPVPDRRIHVTDAFTRHGARFNKGLALESAWDAVGRDGWWLIHDADVILPDHLPLDGLRPEALHGARRRVLADPARWHPGLDWAEAEPIPDGGPVGFFQLFRADCPTLRDRRPWYDVSFPHAGGGDSAFLHHFAHEDRVVLPMDVLHLGPVDAHWFGADPAGKALMAKYVYRNGWDRGVRNFPPEVAAQAGELPGRVAVPGYEPSTYRLPFERP